MLFLLLITIFSFIHLFTELDKWNKSRWYF